MKVSIQTKLLVMCIFLVFLTITGISATYYVLTKQDKQRESRQRIRIAFEIILSDFAEQVETYTTRFSEFLAQDPRLLWATDFYNQDATSLASGSVIAGYFTKALEELQGLGRFVSTDRLLVYGADGRLLLVYQQQDGEEHAGIFGLSAEGAPTYLSADDLDQLNQLLFSGQPIPEFPLPQGIPASYDGEIPEKIRTGSITERQRLGIRITAPMYQKDTKIGVLVGDVFYTQKHVEHYASLSKTAINLFAGTQRSIGTLPEQEQLPQTMLEQGIACDNLLQSESDTLALMSVVVGEREYYEGYCVLTNAQEPVGAITVNLPQSIEKAAIKKILIAVLTVAGISLVVALILSLLFSRRAIRAIQSIVDVIGSASEGDLRETTVMTSGDEIGMLARKLNQMILQLRGISGQLQHSSQAVDVTADAIFDEIQTLSQRMQQQSLSVENTTDSARRINQFITSIVTNTNELLAATEEILSSIHETRASREEVTKSIGHLAKNLQVILASVE
ncbi:HAMP domain-containing protein, partial [candidate division KSB3 bacterium]|nr:HAMP domain-containing protein [candidate division KSB3 bacterium]MBD3325055.1 HAMP domain-containing protein [candidate division KSB3 bacterium]